MAGIIAKNYAEALFNIAVEEGKVELYKKELQEINKCIEENPELFKFMGHPRVMKSDKKEILRKLFKYDEFIMNFLEIIVDKGRFNYFGDICREFVLQANKALNIEKAEVTSATKLTEEELQKIQMLLQKRFNKNIEVVEKIDKNCIAGVKVKIKDKVLDNTVAGRLKAIKEAVSNNSLVVNGGDRGELKTGRNQ
ncbi:MAG: F0F1 ATP synthase subunit delta [Clostridiaceae bacterium]